MLIVLLKAAGFAALRVLVGAGFVGTTAAVVEDNDPSSAMPSSPEVKEDYLFASCRPLSAWRKW